MNVREGKIKGEVVDCAISLGRAIQEAGGTVGGHLMDMIVREFIAEVAGQNHIRFVFEKPEEGA